MESISETCNSSSSPFHSCENPVNFRGRPTIHPPSKCIEVHRANGLRLRAEITQSPALARSRALLRDHPAGHSRPGITGRIALHIIGHGMYNKRSPTPRENRMGVVTHGDARRDHGGLCSSIRRHSKVRHVAGMWTLRVHQTMVLHVRIEVPAGRGKSRAFALRGAVNVNGVFAWRQILQVEIDFYALRRG